jgi:hypothetical protein
MSTTASKNGHANGRADGGAPKHARRFTLDQLKAKARAAGLIAPAPEANGAGRPLNTIGNGSPPAAAPADGRTAGGQFAPGHRFAKGNPHHRKMAELRRAVLRMMTPERLNELLEALFAQGKAGDVTASKLLLSYALGKPPRAIDPDGDDVHEWQLVSSWPGTAAVAAAVLDGVCPGAAVDTARGTALLQTRTIEGVLEKMHKHARAAPDLFGEDYKAETEARRRRAARA